MNRVVGVYDEVGGFMRHTRLGLQVVALSVGAGAWLSAGSAAAHGVTVDGDASDWSTRVPNTSNLAVVARDASNQGELVWLDAGRDTRTDLVTPETGADLQSFVVTADRTSLYFRVTLGPETGVVSTPPQIQIAIDSDRVTGSGNTPFAGFADTDVAPEAAWERLVQTQGGPGGTVRVRDTTYATVAMGTIATNATTNVTEIAIPWTSLPAGTLDALRFTVAIFRENAMGDTVDIMGSSDALDVISDYGDPTVFAGVPTNTFVEVMDGVVSHSLEVWFDRTTREVYAPLLVVRVMVSAPGSSAEWFEVRNQTPLTLDLSQYAVGDEELPDGTEYMGVFPAGATLASGGLASIADIGANFMASYGAPADYVIETGTPLLLSMPTWDASGASFALADSGDEVIVLGWNRTVVDVVAFQLGAYPGVTPRTAPGSNRIMVRDPSTGDTDNCIVDFPLVVDDCGPGAGTCTTCRTCRRYACLVDTGASCDDGDMCTTGTTCSAAALCAGGSTVSCNDSNPCTTDSCAAATGCANTINAGALCDDGRSCTTGDICSMAGVCGGTASCDDMNPCTDDTCGPSGCVSTPVSGRACSDGSMCTTGDACNAMGMCRGTTVTCMEDTNPCTTAMCVAATGCGFVNNTASCSDGDACTTGDACSMGACRPGMFTCDAGAPFDAFVPPIPDAFVPPMPDASVAVDDAAIGDDAGTMLDDDAAVIDEDAGSTVEDDAGAVSLEDSGAVATTDSGARDGGAVDGGRLDGGRAAVDAAGSGLPPSSSGCACRTGTRSSEHSYAWLAGLLAIGVAMRRKRATR